MVPSSDNQDQDQNKQFIGMDEALKQCALMNETVLSFWSRHPVAQDDTNKINQLTMKIYRQLSQDYSSFHAAYPLMVFNFSRGIYDKISLIKFFTAISSRGSLGSDEQQIKDVAGYIARATAARMSSPGREVPKSHIKKHKKKLIEYMMAEKMKFKNALQEVKNREESGAKEQEETDNYLSSANDLVSRFSQ